MSNDLVNKLIIPFFIGGGVITGVKYLATESNNPALAAIVGGLPIGLLSIYFLQPNKTVAYSRNYFVVTSILLVAIALFYLLRTNTKLANRTVFISAVLFWVVMVSIRYYFTQPKK